MSFIRIPETIKLLEKLSGWRDTPSLLNLNSNNISLGCSYNLIVFSKELTHYCYNYICFQVPYPPTQATLPGQPRATTPSATPPRATTPWATTPRATPTRATPPTATPTRAIPPRVISPQASPSRQTPPAALFVGYTGNVARATPPRAAMPRAALPRATTPVATPPRAAMLRATPPQLQYPPLGPPPQWPYIEQVCADWQIKNSQIICFIFNQ